MRSRSDFVVNRDMPALRIIGCNSGSPIVSAARFAHPNLEKNPWPTLRISCRNRSVLPVTPLSRCTSLLSRLRGRLMRWRNASARGRKLLVCGNGGSAADGADFSAEFGCRFVTDRRPYPALNLAQGGSLMSAIGNDYGYDEVFARQVAGLGQKGDVLVAITTSGNSKNILRALEEGNCAWTNDSGVARSKRRTGKRNGGNRAPRAQRDDGANSGGAQIFAPRHLWPGGRAFAEGVTIGPFIQRANFESLRPAARS